MSNSEIGDWHDWTSLGLAGLGVISEFTGFGEAWDGAVGVVIAVGTVSYDIYDATRGK